MSTYVGDCDDACAINVSRSPSGDILPHKELQPHLVGVVSCCCLPLSPLFLFVFLFFLLLFFFSRKYGRGFLLRFTQSSELCRHTTNIVVFFNFVFVRFFFGKRWHRVCIFVGRCLMTHQDEIKKKKKFELNAFSFFRLSCRLVIVGSFR